MPILIVFGMACNGLASNPLYRGRAVTPFTNWAINLHDSYNMYHSQWVTHNSNPRNLMKLRHDFIPNTFFYSQTDSSEIDLYRKNERLEKELMKVTLNLVGAFTVLFSYFVWPHTLCLYFIIWVPFNSSCPVGYCIVGQEMFSYLTPTIDAFQHLSFLVNGTSL